MWESKTMQEKVINYELLQKLVFGVGNKLKTVREHRGLSIEKLAEKSAVGKEHIAFMETHKIELLDSDLCKIAEVLGIDEGLLLDNSMLLTKQEEVLFNNIFSQIKSSEDKRYLQEQILNWLSIVLYGRRQEWQNTRQNSVDILCLLQRKQDALKRSQNRDKKYAPFREYFKNLQRQKFLEYQKQGKNMSANGFVVWFMEHLPEDISIPYRQSNLKNKLTQLAQANNREFKKAFECKS